MLKNDTKNHIAIIIACNKVSHITHRKKQTSIERFLPPSHCLKCSQHILSWNICLCLLHTWKNSARPSFTHPIPSCKASVYFWLSRLAILTGTKLNHVEIYPSFTKLHSRNWVRTLPFILESRREVGRATPETWPLHFAARRKTLVLIDTWLLRVHQETQSI